MPPATCTICDTLLPPFASVEPPVCTALPCRWRYQALGKHQLCQICGRQLSHADQSAGACRDRECWVTLGDQRRRARQADLDLRVEGFRATVVAAHPRLRGRPLPVAVIPGSALETSRVPKRRREALRRRLTWVTQQPPPPPVAEPLQSAVPATLSPAVVQAACTSCRGACCQSGGDHAYVTPATIQRVRHDHPALSDEQIVDRYLSFVGERSYTRSCLFHQPTGCGLPREMRSDTCNAFFCDPMLELFKSSTAPTDPAFIAIVNHFTMREGLLYDGDRIDSTRPPGVQ